LSIAAAPGGAWIGADRQKTFPCKNTYNSGGAESGL